MATSAAANDILYDGTVVLADGRAAGTAAEIDFANKESWDAPHEFVCTVRNPGTSALTVVFRNTETFSGTTTYPEVERWTVNPASNVVLVVGAAWGLGEASRISVSNDALIGTGTGYTVHVRVRQGA